MSRIQRKYILPPRTVLYLLLTTFICSVAVAMISIWWASRVDEMSNQRWCGLVVRMDDTYREKPPGSELGRDIASEFTKLRHDFGCNTTK